MAFRLAVTKVPPQSFVMRAPDRTSPKREAISELNDASASDAGRPVDFEALFAGLYPVVFRYCLRLTGDPDYADDAAQEAFVRMLERGVEGDDDAMRVWLFRVATRFVRDRARHRETRERILEKHPFRPGAPERPDAEAARRERQEVVRGTLDELEERERELLVLSTQGFTYREIAEVVEVAPGSVGTLLARARREFATRLRARGWPHDASD